MTQQITKSITVKQDVTAVYRLWSDFEYFPQFMKYVQAVYKEGDNKSRWEVTGPLGKTVTWQAEMTRNEPNKRIAWNSKDMDGTITTSGEVTFNSLPQNETQITVTMNYTPPAGKVGELVAALFANPEKQVEEDLRHFKEFAEGMYDRVWAS
jgi:uncharacterized membrane protein